MKTISYLTGDEKYIFHALKNDLKRCNSIQEIKTIEEKLDALLCRAIYRYLKERKLN